MTVLAPEAAKKSSTGIGLIDEHVDVLSYLVEQLFHPDVVCSKRGYNCQRLADLTLFCRRNLEAEERLMETSGYPGIDEHRRHHERFIEALEKLHANLECSYYDNAMPARFVDDWIKHHSEQFDKPLATYLSSSQHSSNAI